jgi:hypothetical protein
MIEVKSEVSGELNPALSLQVIGMLMKILASLLLGSLFLMFLPQATEQEPKKLMLSWADNYLTIRGPRLPKEGVRVQYLEAYCRPGSTDRDWAETVIKHKTKLISASDAGHLIKLRCTLEDGVIVTHEITAGEDEVRFELVATNPTESASAAHWAQPCIRVGNFTGRGQRDYVTSCFIFLDGRLARLPTQPWADKARYTPGQVYCPKHVNRRDVNPRPLSELVPSNGLVGCFSQDGDTILATAWEPYQELFQGVAVCIHSDFRIGGLRVKEKKKIRGKIYVVKADPADLLRRYQRDFPEHVKARSPNNNSR